MNQNSLVAELPQTSSNVQPSMPCSLATVHHARDATDTHSHVIRQPCALMPRGRVSKLNFGRLRNSSVMLCTAAVLKCPCCQDQTDIILCTARLGTGHAGQDQADSSVAPRTLSRSHTPSASNAATQSTQGTAPRDGNHKASESQLDPDTASKPNLVSVLKSSRGHAPSKVGSPRSRQPGSPADRKTRSGTLLPHLASQLAAMQVIYRRSYIQSIA